MCVVAIRQNVDANNEINEHDFSKYNGSTTKKNERQIIK